MSKWRVFMTLKSKVLYWTLFWPKYWARATAGTDTSAATEAAATARTAKRDDGIDRLLDGSHPGADRPWEAYRQDTPGGCVESPGHATRARRRSRRPGPGRGRRGPRPLLRRPRGLDLRRADPPPVERAAPRLADRGAGQPGALQLQDSDHGPGGARAQGGARGRSPGRGGPPLRRPLPLRAVAGGTARSRVRGR